MENNYMKKGFKVFLLIFALTILIFIQEGNQQKVVDAFNKLTKKDIQLMLEYELKGKNLMYFNGSLIKWEGSSLVFLDKDGNDKWVKDFPFQEPEIIMGDNFIYVMDKTSGDIYKVTKNGDTALRIQMKQPVFNIKEDNDYIIVHIKELDEKLVFMDSDGNILFDDPIEGNVLTYSINRDGTDYIYSTLNLGQSEVKSTLKFNKKESEDSTRDINNEIIIYTELIKDNIVVLTDTSLRLFDDNEMIWQKDYPLIKDIYVDNNKIHLLYGDNLEIINFKGEVESKITFGLNYEKITKLDKYIVIFGGKNLMILQNGREILKYIGEGEIISIGGNDDLLSIQYENSVEIYRFDIIE